MGRKKRTGTEKQKSYYHLKWQFLKVPLVGNIYILTAYQENDVCFVETTFPDLHDAFDTGNVFALDEIGVRDEESSRNEQTEARHGELTVEEKLTCL